MATHAQYGFLLHKTNLSDKDATVDDIIPTAIQNHTSDGCLENKEQQSLLYNRT